MSDIVVCPHNAVYNTIECDDSIAADLHDYFSFEAPNAQWVIRRAQQKAKLLGMPTRFSGWNGRINLFQKKTHKLYAGLNERLEMFAQDRNLSIQYDYKISETEFSVVEAREFIKTLNLPEKYDERYYQLETFIHNVRNRRNLNLSPTGSGKSMMIYLLMCYLKQPKTLIIVPTLTLMHQMLSGFKEYGFDVDNKVQIIWAGTDKEIDTNRQVIISTWQSIYNMNKDYFKEFRMVVVDEVHGADSKSIKGIMEKLTLCLYRFGYTGTLKDSKCHRLVLEGLFGPIYQSATTQELIEAKYLVDLRIKALVLQYDENICKACRRLDYQGEIDFLTTHDKRNRFIQNLALSLEGNTLLLFRMIDHGKLFYQNIRSQCPDIRPVYLIYGGTPGEEREQIRQILNKEKNAILVRSEEHTS